MTEQKTRRKAWGGIILVVLGLIFLMENLRIIPDFDFMYYAFKWQSILIIIGVVMLTSGRRHGLIFLVIGGIFLIPDIFYRWHFYWHDWWPLVLVAIGVSILLRGRQNPSSAGTSDENYIDDMSVFGGTKKMITASALRGGKITSVFGGSELNCRINERSFRVRWATGSFSIDRAKLNGEEFVFL